MQKNKIKTAKKFTLQKLIFVYWVILFGIMFVLMALYGSIILHNSRKEMLDNANIIAEHYGFQMNKDISSMLEAVNSIYVNNLYYMKIRTGNLDDYEWIGAAYYLEGSLQEKVDSFDYMGGMFFYDAARDSMRSVYSDFGFDGTRAELNTKLRSVLTGNSDIQKDCVFLECDEETYLVYFFKTGERYLGFVVNLDQYFITEEDLSIFYVYQNTVVSSCGNSKATKKEIEKVVGRERPYIRRSGEILIPVDMDSMDMSLVFSFDSLKVSDMWKKPELWMLVILIPFVLFVFLILLFKKLRSIILYPIEHIAIRVNEMKEEGHRSDITKKIQIEEFDQINRKIDEMLQQMVQLQEEKFEEKQRVQEVQLQYYQLQIKPHFFLNCLNTISSLLENNSIDAANDMIRSFSSYFRYIFRDQRVPVTVEEEIREVKAYCNIYSLKGGFPILLQVDVKEEAKDCRIPILCIQTFVENSIKYAVKTGAILIVKIQVRIIIDENGVRKISICISDNGNGYTEKMLDELNRSVVDFKFRPYHIGIDNLKYRIWLMYQERAKWYFYNSPYGGAIAEIMLPEEKDNEHTDY